MALEYVVTKRVFGFDKDKNEKYVAKSVRSGRVSFSKMCGKVSRLCIMWLLFNYTYLNLHLSSIDRAYNHPSWNDLKSFQYIRLRIVQFPLL